MIREYTREQERQLPVGGDAAEMTALKLWFCAFDDLSGLERYTSLRTLVVAGFPERSLDVLTGVPSLTHLRLIHLPGVTDLAPLAKLPLLETLSLATLPSWDSSGKVTEVASLEPLRQLPALRSLELLGVRPKDRSLRPLQRSASLRSVRVSKYPKAEVRRFYDETGLSDGRAPADDIADWS